MNPMVLYKRLNDLAIMPKAIVDYIIYGKSVEDTINECDDLIMYQKVCKIGKTYKYAMYGDKPLKEKVKILEILEAK